MSDETVRIDDGGPAFPVTIEVHSGTQNFVSSGLTLRAYFAAKAMQSLILAGCTNDEASQTILGTAKKFCDGNTAVATARLAVVNADALIAELRKAGGK